ncbi:MAG: sensor histidine kinase [Pseudonocardiales bacterium]|nr:MAG: sensor histidine kinase [Pseudonocardiales bacterium]
MIGSSTDNRSLRGRIATGIVGITGLAVLLFALPLAVAVSQLYRSHEYAELQRDATRVAALVPDNPVDPDHPGPVPGSRDIEARIGLYTPVGVRATGSGPARSVVAGAAHDGRVHQGAEAGTLTVAVPVLSDGIVVGVVRADVPASIVTTRTRRSWAAMALLGLVVLGVAALLARRQSRRIALPLERLTVAARALGDGNFAISPEHSGIREADAAGTALRDTAARLGHLLERERAFSADASHQLRTPLTGLLLGLESALDRPGADLRDAVTDALDRARRLQSTVDDLLSLRRDTGGPAGGVDVELEMSAAGRHWLPVFAARRRRLAVTSPANLPTAMASAAALRQILDVLLDNALQHGAGDVALTAADLGHAVAVEVTDDGPGLTGGAHGDPEVVFTRRAPDAHGHGIGLALARSLAEADGGRLVVRRAARRPVFALLLQVADAVVASPSPSSRSSPPGQPSSS